MKVFKSLIRKNRIWVIISLAVTFLSVGTQLVWTTCIGNLADRIERRENLPGTFLIMMGFLLTACALTAYLNQLISRYTAEKMGDSLRMGFADKILRQKQNEAPEKDSDKEVSKESGTVKNRNENSGKGFCGTGSFEAMSKVQNELMQASDYMTNTLFDIVWRVLSAVIILIFFFTVNPVLTLVILTPMMVTVAVTRLLGKKLVPLVNMAMDEKTIHNKVAYSAITGFEAVSIYDGKGFFRDKYRENIENWGRAETKKERMNALCNSMSGILSQVPLLLLFAVGALMIWKGQITFGTLIIFLNMQKGVLRTLMNLPTWMISVKSFFVHLGRVEDSYEG